MTIEDGGTITSSVFGDFSGDGFVELMLVRNQTTIELLRVTRERPHAAAPRPSFSIVRTVATIRIGSEPRDCIVVGSDAGAVTLLSYQRTTN